MKIAFQPRVFCTKSSARKAKQEMQWLLYSLLNTASCRHLRKMTV